MVVKKRPSELCNFMQLKQYFSTTNGKSATALTTRFPTEPQNEVCKKLKLVTILLLAKHIITTIKWAVVLHYCISNINDTDVHKNNFIDKWGQSGEFPDVVVSSGTWVGEIVP